MSIDETVRGMWRALVEADFPAGVPLQRPELPSQPLAIRATDSGDGWIARSDDGSLSIETADASGSGEALIEGTANDLMLFLWGRTAADEVRVHGSREVADAWNLCLRAGL